MENSSPLILDISSDEETDFGCARKGVGGGEYGDREDCEWLSKLLDEVGGKKDDDSDDVVFVSEVLPRNPKKPRLECFKQLAKVVDDDDDDDDDDDCVILDGDPDKSIVVFNGKVDSDDSDDLEIVGEKGEVACRDFPHPRHLCAKFPFASTPHEVHCGQCHCHVCDSLAPCAHWGTGISSIAHCHANDKDEYWIAERKRMKKGDKVVPIVPSTSGTLQAFFQRSQVRAVAPQQPNYLPQNQVLNPVTIRPCSISTVSLPGTVNPGRVHLSGCVVPSNKARSSLASRQLHPAYNSKVLSRYKSNNAGSRSAQSLPPPAVFKRTGLVGASPNIRPAYRSQLSRDKNGRASHTPVLNGSNQQSTWVPTAHSVLPQPKLSSPLSVDCGANCLPSQSHIQSKAFSSSVAGDSVHYQSQMPSQPYLSSNFAGAMPLQPNVSSQQSEENFQSSYFSQPHVYHPSIPIPSQTVQTYHTDAGNDFHDQLHSGSMFPAHPHVGNNFENQSSQPEAHNNIIPLFVDGQNDFQQVNHTQNDIDASPADFGFASDFSHSHGNLQMQAEISQCQGTVAAYNSQHQSIGKDNHHQSIASVDNIHQGSVVVADNSSVTNDNDNQFPGSMVPDLLGFQFDNWMFENHSLPGAFEVPMSPVWNVFSPEPASLDTGTLFDI